MANENGILLEAIQMGLEATAGTLVPATHQWSGKGALKFLDKLHEGDYATGVAGGAVEDIIVASTGTEVTLADTDFSVELGIYLFNMAILAVPGPATSFPFVFPSTAPNAIKTFTWEVVLGGQEYEFGYGFAKKLGIHGDCEANDGIMQANAVIEGRKCVPSTLTAALAQIASREPLSLRNATCKLDALGTAYGSGSHMPAFLRAISLDIEPGWGAGHYSDSRADKDFSVAEGGGVGYKITGELRVSMIAQAATEIANGRAGTGRILEVAVSGTTSRACKLQLPIYWKPDEVKTDDEANGLRLVRVPFVSKYSRTVTAQAPTFDLTASASTTVT